MREIKFRAWNGRWWEVQTVQPKREDHKGWYKQHGYVKRLVSEHPFADKRGYVMEHRLVVEEKLEYFLPRNVVIHHKNGVRDDNRFENLEILSEQSRHAEKHDSGKRNPNGRFVAQEPIFDDIKFRLLNKNTGLTQIYTLRKLIGTTFRRSQFKFRGRFTDLHDKNGKEIYEGDIVKKDTPFQQTGVVVYGNYGFWVDIPSKNIPIDEPLMMFEGCEVVGNIYENPELYF